jgi:hypothetical protein
VNNDGLFVQGVSSFFVTSSCAISE